MQDPLTTELVEIGMLTELFHTDLAETFSRFFVDQHRETWSLKSARFKGWLAREYYQLQKGNKVPNSAALNDAINVLGFEALSRSELPVFTRVAEDGGKLFIDIGDKDWRVLEISHTGWRIVDDSPVKFRRPPGMQMLPTPTPGGNIEQLRPFVNLVGNDWELFVAKLTSDFLLKIQHPLLALHGGEGTAKSTLSRINRRLIDPSAVPLRSWARNEYELMISARNNWVMPFDNVSFLSQVMSDSLSKLVTGAGFSVRTLYETAGETLFKAHRVIILNGIEEVILRGDLLSRTLLLNLPEIDDQKRVPDEKFWDEFQKVEPQVFGALLDLVSGALVNRHMITLPGHPRMGDFAVWATAIEAVAGWPQGTFMTAYEGNTAAASSAVLESSVVAVAVCKLAGVKGSWKGTPTQLLAELEQFVDWSTTRRRNWPANGQSLSNKLKRLPKYLRRVDVELNFGQTTGSNSQRYIEVKKVPQGPTLTSGGSATQASRATPQAAQTTPVTPDSGLSDGVYQTPAGTVKVSGFISWVMGCNGCGQMRYETRLYKVEATGRSERLCDDCAVKRGVTPVQPVPQEASGEVNRPGDPGTPPETGAESADSTEDKRAGDGDAGLSGAR